MKAQAVASLNPATNMDADIPGWTRDNVHNPQTGVKPEEFAGEHKSVSTCVSATPEMPDVEELVNCIYIEHLHLVGRWDRGAAEYE